MVDAGRGGRDFGGTVLEYTVVFALVAALAVGLVTAAPSIGGTVAEEIGRMICAAFGGENCGESGDLAGGPGNATESDPSGNSGGDGTGSDAPIDSLGDDTEGDGPGSDSPDGSAEDATDEGPDPIVGPAIGEDGWFEPLGYPGQESVSASARFRCFDDLLKGSMWLCRTTMMQSGKFFVRPEWGVTAAHTQIQNQSAPYPALCVDYATGEQSFYEAVAYSQVTQNTVGAHAGGKVEGKVGPVPVEVEHLTTEGSYGSRTFSEVTVDARQFQLIADGVMEAPNPFDPRSMPMCSSILLDEESFTEDAYNTKVWAFTSALLRHRLRIAEGESVSAEVERISECHMAVTVGESETMRINSNFSAGAEFHINTFKAGAALGLQNWRGYRTGNTYTVILDICTEEGWDAYQAFIADGVLPEAGAPGVEESYESETFNFTLRNRAFFEMEMEGKFNVPKGMGTIIPLISQRWAQELTKSQHNYTVTTRDDGSALHVAEITEDGVTMVISQEVTSRGYERDPTYDFLLRDVSAQHSGVSGVLWDGIESDSYSDSTHMMLSFTEADLMDLQDMVIAYGADQMGWSEQEMRDYIVQNPDGAGPVGIDNVDWGPPTGSGLVMQDIAYAEHSGQILDALRYNSGWNDPNRLVENLYHVAGLLQMADDPDADMSDYSDYMVGEGLVLG